MHPIYSKQFTSENYMENERFKVSKKRREIKQVFLQCQFRPTLTSLKVWPNILIFIQVLLTMAFTQGKNWSQINDLLQVLASLDPINQAMGSLKLYLAHLQKSTSNFILDSFGGISPITIKVGDESSGISLQLQTMSGLRRITLYKDICLSSILYSYEIMKACNPRSCPFLLRESLKWSQTLICAKS